MGFGVPPGNRADQFSICGTPHFTNPDERLRRSWPATVERVSDIGAFSPSAGEVRERVLKAFPKTEITFEINRPRAGIVDTWPADVDDSAARRDSGWKPEYDFGRGFDEYLVPQTSRIYAATRK